MNYQQIINYYPYLTEEQKCILQNLSTQTSPFNFIRMERRTGKTTLSLIMACDLMLSGKFVVFVARGSNRIRRRIIDGLRCHIHHFQNMKGDNEEIKLEYRIGVDGLSGFRSKLGRIHVMTDSDYGGRSFNRKIDFVIGNEVSKKLFTQVIIPLVAARDTIYYGFASNFIEENPPFFS